MDYTWIAPTILAIGSFIASVAGAIVAVVAARRAGRADASATEAKQQSIITHTAVNSRMDELLKLAREESALKATAIEKAAERGRKADALIAATPITTVDAASAAQKLLAAAADQAKKLLDDAAVAAAKLLDAR